MPIKKKFIKWKKYPLKNFTVLEKDKHKILQNPACVHMQVNTNYQISALMI